MSPQWKAVPRQSCIGRRPCLATSGLILPLLFPFCRPVGVKLAAGRLGLGAVWCRFLRVAAAFGAERRRRRPLVFSGCNRLRHDRTRATYVLTRTDARLSAVVSVELSPHLYARDGRTMSNHDRFFRAMNALQKEQGDDASERAYLVFATVVDWLRRDGHGTITLSAKDHKLAVTVRADTVLTAVEKIR